MQKSITPPTEDNREGLPKTTAKSSLLTLEEMEAIEERSLTAMFKRREDRKNSPTK